MGCVSASPERTGWNIKKPTPQSNTRIVVRGGGDKTNNNNVPQQMLTALIESIKRVVLEPSKSIQTNHIQHTQHASKATCRIKSLVQERLHTIHIEPETKYAIEKLMGPNCSWNNIKRFQTTKTNVSFLFCGDVAQSACLSPIRTGHAVCKNTKAS